MLVNNVHAKDLKDYLNYFIVVNIIELGDDMFTLIIKNNVDNNFLYLNRDVITKAFVTYIP